MIAYRDFPSLLAAEFPALAPMLQEHYSNSNALMCLAWRTQADIVRGDLPAVAKYFIFVDRCLREGEDLLLPEIEAAYVCQLTLDTSGRAENDLWWVAPFSIWKAKRTAKAALAAMPTALRQSWETAQQSRGGRLTELDFIEHTGRNFPELKAQPPAVAFVINPYVNDLLERTQSAIDSGDRKTADRIFTFLLPFISEGITPLKWWLWESFLKKLVWRGPHADRIKKITPKLLQAVLKIIATQISEAEQQAAKARAEADARRAVNYAHIPEPYRQLVARLEELSGVEFVPGADKDIKRLKRLGLPDAVVEFFSVANPSDFVSLGGVDLSPADAVGRAAADDWFASLAKLRLIAFASDFSGDVLCFDLRVSNQAGAPLIVQVSHEWGCPQEALKHFLEEQKTDGATASTSLEEEYWQMFWEEAVTPYAPDFAVCLQKLIESAESPD